MFKMLVYGCFTTGRSALTRKFVVYDRFVEVVDPIVEGDFRKQVVVDGNNVEFLILDWDGTEEYSPMREIYMKQCQGILLVYDVTNRRTFDGIDDFRKECCRIRQSDRIPVVLCGNKIDLTDKRQVETSEGHALAEKYGWPFIEASAKTGENVEEAFLTVYRSYGNSNENDGNRKDDDKKKCIIC